jgi:hypothetical protein
MKNLNIYFFVLMSILIVSCKCDCPDSYLFEKDEMPYWVDRDFDLYDVAIMTFLNNNGDTLSLWKDYSIKNETNRDLLKHATCKEDNTEVVDIYYDRTWNRVFFVSDNNDSLGFQYYTIKPSLGSFSYKKYDDIDHGPYREPINTYKNVMFKIDGLNYSLTALILEQEPNLFHTKLSGGFNVLDIKFNDVYYHKHPVLSINVYFNNEVGIVGIEEHNGVKWIRLL